MEINESIGCDVKDCKYHAKSKQFCVLNQIKVVKCSEPSRSKHDTDCGSFEPAQ